MYVCMYIYIYKYIYIYIYICVYIHIYKLGVRLARARVNPPLEHEDHLAVTLPLTRV